MSDPEFVVPPAVEPGDSVAVVAPSSGGAEQFPHVYDLGLERMREEFDLEPVEFPTARRDGEYLYDHPEERAADVMDAFRDPDVSAVVATIGGNDQVRILDRLDPAVLRENPTRFYGWSDNTHLALYLWNLGIVSYYGGSVMTEYATPGGTFEHTAEYLRRALFEERIGEIEPAEVFSDDPADWAAGPEALEAPPETEPSEGWRWANGTDPVEGRVWGGCWGSLDSVFLADRPLPDPDRLDGAVLAVETSEALPDPERIAGQLRALGERGLLERFAAVLVGRAPTRSFLEEPPAEEREQYRKRQREVFTELFAEYNPDAPLVLDVEFGHAAPTVPIPIGGRVAVDPHGERIEFHGA
jgi:muramoyltetrapeptide carboxypeptidase LdcA involved in peptidoglycan recycling